MESDPPVSVLRLLAIAFVLLFLAPLAVSAALYALDGEAAGWRTADRSSAGLLKPASEQQEAVVRVFAARTVRWKGIFATHCWIVVKPKGASSYTRYDYTAWGEPIRVNGFVADGRWFGRVPDVVFAADGERAERAIPQIRAAIESYKFREQSDYRAWPGPNSNTFVAAVMAAAPELDAKLPTTAVGKDYPYGGDWVALTPSKTGVRFTLGGYGGLTVGWREGLELNVLGAVFGVELRRPALNLPGLGRFGV
ncbi:DUF3750 domain-containing protein [Chenggangzhangella methanolivorans]|uniref:DUF3750 domain-containing protein n=1 Tax=Chenggangzhangella methanolivorans TaxID=1437009 RepID=A0A9E6UHA9_9HYPH|nr:DUF3750 domain-containing protein [Chenggangzhangella methanolivorans]QZN99597.1 DUF3750 domain-containing protein [Chenggangzhangella methanolivorans]